MTTEEGGAGATVSAVSALMEERRRYESWIAALDQKRAGTPDHVFTRVYGDYQGRLQAVVDTLATHADGLRQEIDDLSRRLASARAEHQRATDERAEAELRAHVGELSSDDWNNVAAASDQRLSELAANGDAIDKELGRTRELLADTERPTPAAAVAVPEPEPVSDVAEATAHVPAAITEPASEPAPAPVPVPEPEPAVAAAPAPARTPTPRASSPAQRAPGQFDELSFLRSVVESPAGPIEAAPSDEPDEASKLDSFARHSRDDILQRATGDQPLITRSGGEQAGRDGPQVVFQRTPGSALDPVKDPALEGAKTLKCGECGALNYPTEWYCERCGAELASL